MRAMRAEGFSGYQDLKLVDIPKPAVTDGRVLVRIPAAGVTPLEHTILSGGYPRAKAPLVLGGEGAGVVEDGGGTAFPVGSRVMFTGPYGVSENGTYSEWLAVRKENLCLIPDNIEDISAAGVPVAYLTAQMTLSFAGFAKGKTVLSPAIGGSVGNAVTQIAKAQGAKHAISTTTAHKLFGTLSSEEVLREIAPGRNRLLYLWGHLTAIHDAMLPLLGLRGRLHPEFDVASSRIPTSREPAFLRTKRFTGHGTPLMLNCGRGLKKCRGPTGSSGTLPYRKKISQKMLRAIASPSC